MSKHKYCKQVSKYYSGRNPFKYLRIWLLFNKPVRCDWCRRLTQYKYLIDSIGLFSMHVSLCQDCFEGLSEVAKFVRRRIPKGQ